MSFIESIKGEPQKNIFIYWRGRQKESKVEGKSHEIAMHPTTAHRSTLCQSRLARKSAQSLTFRRGEKGTHHCKKNYEPPGINHSTHTVLKLVKIKSISTIQSNFWRWIKCTLNLQYNARQNAIKIDWATPGQLHNLINSSSRTVSVYKAILAIAFFSVGCDSSNRVIVK